MIYRFTKALDNHVFINMARTSVCYRGFPGGSDGKESSCNAGDLDSFPGLEKSPREGKGYPLQYSGELQKPGSLQSIGLQRVGRD